MSGDWLKMEISTPEKPEVLEISFLVGTSADEVVGKLFRVWRWFDQQTNAGSVTNMCAATLAAATNTSEEFLKAMKQVGWIEYGPDFVALPNFTRHNGQTAKNRALTARRVAAHKRNGNGSGNGKVTHASLPFALPREEKRRSKEERGQTAKPLRGSRLPADWIPGPEGTAFCKEERPDLDPRDVLERFRDHWLAQPGQKGVKADWMATWRNWVRREGVRHG